MCESKGEVVENRGKGENFHCTWGKKGGGAKILYFREIYTPVVRRSLTALDAEVVLFDPKGIHVNASLFCEVDQFYKNIIVSLCSF